MVSDCYHTSLIVRKTIRSDLPIVINIHMNSRVHFLSQGEEWEKAWDSHVLNYKNPCKRQSKERCFKSSKFVLSMNADKNNPDYHAWSDDHFTLCKSHLFSLNPKGFLYLKKAGLSSFAEAMTTKYMESYRGVGMDDELFKVLKASNDHLGRPCKIISMNEDETFDVVTALSKGEKQYFKIDQDAKVLIPATVNSTGFRYWNKPFTSDMFSPTAFRHTIDIPDEIFPELWKDLVDE
jgi:hypothetical protein